MKRTTFQPGTASNRLGLSLLIFGAFIASAVAFSPVSYAQSVYEQGTYSSGNYSTGSTDAPPIQSPSPETPNTPNTPNPGSPTTPSPETSPEGGTGSPNPVTKPTTPPAHGTAGEAQAAKLHTTGWSLWIMSFLIALALAAVLGLWFAVMRRKRDHSSIHESTNPKD